MEKEIRLDKFLADMGRGTRSQIKEAVRKGRVQINGEAVKQADKKILPSRDTVLFDGSCVTYVTTEYYMLHKPQGVVSATEDNLHKTVIELIEDRNRKDLFPVGRLDIDTEGLLLITNDGELAHKLLSPKKHVDKCYMAQCQGRVPESAVTAFKEGLVLSDGLTCLPAVLEILEVSEKDGQETTKVKLTIREGKFHQVKRMMEEVGCPVLYLKRMTMGPLTLDETLHPGEYRPLTEREVEILKQL